MIHGIEWLWRRRRAAFRRFFDHPDGKVILGQLRHDCFVSRSAYSTDPHEMAARTALQDLYRSIVSQAMVTDEDISAAVLQAQTLSRAPEEGE